MRTALSKPLLHVIFSPSGAGSLRSLLIGLGRAEEVASPSDDFSFGPIDGTDRAAWVDEELATSGWAEVAADTPSFLKVSCSADVLPVAWISRREAKSYAGFLWWLSQLRDAPCAVIDVTDLMIAENPADPSWKKLAVSPSVLQPGELADLLDTQTPLTLAQRECCRALWTRLKLENAPLRIINQQGELTSASIDIFDSRLLSFATMEWQKMARMVGEALVSFMDDEAYQAGELVLRSRLCALAEVGALEWRGDLFDMRGCELRLPGQRN